MTETDARAAWLDATTYEEICELTARYVEGGSPYCPWYAGPLDEESGPLIPVLAGLCRAGFMTVASQPGVLQPAFRQRAFVDGLASRPVAEALYRVEMHSDLVVLMAPSGAQSHVRIPVTVEDWRPFTAAGTLGTEQEFISTEFPNLADALGDTWSACIIDPVWGREKYLWDRLSEALLFSHEAHPNLGHPPDSWMI